MLLLSFMKEKMAYAVFFCMVFLCALQQAHASTISGYIYDNHKVGLVDVYVELQDEFYRQINRVRTDGSGKYQFDGVASGTFTIKVLPFQYDFKEDSRLVEVNTITITGSGNGNVYLNEDFYLQPRKGSLAEVELTVVFAQEIPKDAKKIYDQSMGDFSKNRQDEGIAKLREAVKLFPTYFLALSRLGKELTFKGQYEEAAPILIRAVEVNSKSPMTLYYLGLSLNKLNYNKPALTALSQAFVLAPASMQVAFTLGRVERLEGNYEEAEKHLLKAKKLTVIDYPDIHWELAQLYGLNMKRYKEAAEELEKYIKSGKFDDQYTKKIKRLIADYQDKASKAKT